MVSIFESRGRLGNWENSMGFSDNSNNDKNIPLSYKSLMQLRLLEDQLRKTESEHDGRKDA